MKVRARRQWKVVVLLHDRRWRTWHRCFTKRGAERKAKKLANGGMDFLPVSALVLGIGYVHEDEPLPIPMDPPSFPSLDSDSDARSEQP